MNFPGCIMTVLVAMQILLPALSSTESGAQYRGRSGSSSTIRGRTGPFPGRTPSPRATIIPNRSGGFDVYSPRGNSRYLGKAQGNKVFHPNGTSSIVIPDETGGYTVYGPRGARRIFSDENANGE